ncbi:MAG: adenylyl-sulfate kinase [Marmoricola sp.]
MPVPQHCPSPRELDDLELLLGGGLAPRDRFDDDGPVSLALPDEMAASPEGVELVDPEGVPLAHRDPDGRLTARSHPEFGPFRRLHLTPAQARERHPGAVTVPVAGPMTEDDLERIRAHGDGERVLLLAMSGTNTPRGVSTVGLLRTTLLAAELLEDAHVVAVPLADHDDATADGELRDQVVTNYAPGEVLTVPGTGELPQAVAAAVAQDQPAEPGVVVFFTGLSGSGKSTLARALYDRILEQGRRTATSLDGDVVRRNLSKGLTFSTEDRETNIRRIGWVAAEIARHRGIAICSPIAPFDGTRKAVRQMAEDAGGRFVLVHVATPLAECERRDRKGLYAKARRGEIPEFTGISSPYEEPDDATVRVDTTGRSVEDALAEVVGVLPFEVG